MTRLAIALALALLGGCPKSKPAGTTGTPLMAKKISVSWGIDAQGDGADVFLATTDETGKQVSHALGHYAGTCSAVTPGKDMDALGAVDCKSGATGFELQAIGQRDEVLVMKLRIDEGVAPDPMAREELTRIKVPLGAAIEFGH